MKKILIHYHIHYNDIAVYYLEHLKLLFDNYCDRIEIIITSSNYDKNLENDINTFFNNNSFKNFKIIQVKNMGSDVAPIFYIFENKHANIDDYIAFVHIHTKNNKKRLNFGPVKNLNWADELIKNLFNLSHKIYYMDELFKSNVIGLAGSKILYFKSNNNYSTNKYFLEDLKNKFGIDNNIVLNSKFIAGNMWWCNANIIKSLCEKVKYEDFKNDFAKDGNLEHAIERFVGILSNSMGYKYCALTEDQIELL